MIDGNSLSALTYMAPLYLYESAGEAGSLLNQEGDIGHTKTVNFTKEFAQFVNSTFNNPTPEDVMGFIYASMHSAHYRKTYLDLLKIDYPRINFNVSADEFAQVAKVGQQLIALHTMQHKLPVTAQIVNQNNDYNNIVIDAISATKSHCNDEVVLNKDTVIKNVSAEVWDYKIGGYQVLHKYLSARTKRTLTQAELDHIEQIIAILQQTIDLNIQ